MGDIKLSKIDPSFPSLCENKEVAIEKTEIYQKQIYDLLYVMFAHGKYSLLIILQGIDTSGKDGTVRHIFSAANPQGIKVFSFKKPSAEELEHDFIWRCHRHTPISGTTAVFNRSYYEEVTTVKVHPELLKEQRLPDEVIKSRRFFEDRYARINEFERLLSDKGTVILKFFLHISKKEQGERIKERLRNKSKNWKFSSADVRERKFWTQHQKAFESMLNKTSTAHSPWTVVPADNKWYRDFLVSKTLFEALKKLKMKFPRA
jgi:PPK2 family polyphosphate:nucleotide phosphotransferase